MDSSDLIALVALIVTIVGLIPQFYSAFRQKKNNISGKENQTDGQSKEFSKPENISRIGQSIETTEPMPYMLKILLLVIFAVGTFLIELIIFGIIAHFCGVQISFLTMTLFWKVIFGSLFLIPGAFLFLAFLTFIANTTD